MIISTRDRSFLCTDDPTCNFQTCDPASLLRHRKRLHGYISRLSNGSKIAKASKAPTHRGREASMDSSSSASVESTSTLSSHFSLSSCGEGESTSSRHETLASNESSVSSVDSLPPHQDSLLFSDSSSPCSYNHTWDTSPLPELDILPAEPPIQQLQFEYSYQDQQGEPQAKLNDFFLPLQLPNMEQVFPGYETSGQLHGPHGLRFGLDQQLQQNPSAEDNNGSWSTLSVDGSLIFQSHSRPAESFQAPVELRYSPGICSPVGTSPLESDLGFGIEYPT